MRFRVVAWGTCVALMIVAGLPARSTAGGERDAVADAVGRIMDAANTRMKVAMEEARLLEAAGQRDQALALLRTVPAIYEEATKTVRALVGGPDVARPPVARFVGPGVPPPARPTPPIAPRSRPTADPVGPAVEYLLGCQRDDGLFDPRLGSVPGDPVARASETVLVDHATGAVLLALLDVGGPRVDRSSAIGRAVVRAAEALAARSSETLPLLAAWGLATAVSRTGEVRWMPIVRRSVDAALVDVGSTSEVAPWRLTDQALAAAFLHEVLALPIEAELRARIVAGLDALRATARAIPRTQVTTSAARVARDLLVHDVAADAADRFARSEGYAAADRALGKGGDPLEMLLGTVHAQSVYGFDDEAEGRAWWNDVLVPAMNRQARSGPARGSWGSPEGTENVATGRVVTTALLLLAWQVPTTPFLEPVAWPVAAEDDDEGR